mgnify:CR=1 FL=1
MVDGTQYIVVAVSDGVYLGGIEGLQGLARVVCR